MLGSAFSTTSTVRYRSTCNVSQFTRVSTIALVRIQNHEHEKAMLLFAWNSSRKLSIKKNLWGNKIRELILVINIKGWLTHDTSARRTTQIEMPVLMELWKRIKVGHKITPKEKFYSQKFNNLINLWKL
jgi:hypothetical protein